MENRAYIDAGLHIRFDTPFHMGTGHGDVSINRVVRRSADRKPYVPASAIKGAMRMAAERVVRVVDQRFPEELRTTGKQRKENEKPKEYCVGPRPETMCQSKSPCVVCRVFGNVFTGTRLIVEDGHFDTSQPLHRLMEGAFGDSFSSSTSRETITRVQINRKTRGASDGALFSSEYTPGNQVFVSALSGSISLANSIMQPPPAELILLAASVAFVEHIGAEVSVGRGHCQLNITGSDLGEIHVSNGPSYKVLELIDQLERLSDAARV